MQRLNKSPGLVVEELEDEILLYRPSNHQAIHLNATAAAIWKLCDGTRTISEVVDCLVAEYPTERTNITREVQEVVNRLLIDGALVERPAEASC
jgi:hypothetical protein